MSSKKRDSTIDESFPGEIRCPVIDGTQFQLPSRLVREVGFKTPRWDTVQSAKVMWHYHEKAEKAVLANDEIGRPSLEVVEASALSGVSNEDLESGDVSGARVTIISALPDTLYERLTRDSLVLKPIYAADHPALERTCISVYPASEYDRGTLPNVQKRSLTDEDETNGYDSSDVIGSHCSHANSI